jgi:hypothetical protein
LIHVFGCGKMLHGGRHSHRILVLVHECPGHIFGFEIHFVYF